MTSCKSYENDEILINHPVDNTLIDHIDKEARRLIIDNKLDSAILLLQRELQCNDHIDNFRRADLYTMLGACFFQRNEIRKALDLINAGIKLFENDNSEKLIEKDQYTEAMILLANCYRLVHLYDSSLIILSKIHDNAINDYSNKENINYYYLLSDIHTWKAYVYMDIGQIEKSIFNSISAIDIIEKIDTNSCIIANNYTQLGNAFLLMEDYPKAEQYFIKALQIIENCFDNSSIYYAEKNTDLGNLLFEAKRYKESLVCFETSKRIIEKTLPKDDIRIAAANNNLADAYCSLGDIPKGIIHYSLALNVFESIQSYENVCIVLHNLGNAANDLNDLDQAENYYKASLELASTIREKNNINTAYTYQRLGQVHMKRKDFDKGAENYFYSIKELSLIENDSAAYNIYFLQRGILSKTMLLESLYFKGTCELYNYYKYGDSIELANSISTLIRAGQVLDVLRNQYNNEKTKLILNELSDPLFQNLISAILNLQSTKKNTALDNGLLQAIERNKYTALRSLIYSTKASYISYLPTKIVRQIDSLTKRIRQYGNIMSNHKSQIKGENDLVFFNNLLFNTTFILDTLISSTKTKYPKYKNDHFCFSYYSIDEVQEFLPDSTGILEYFYNDSILIIAAINKNSHKIHISYPGKEFSEKIETFSNSIQFSNSKTFIENGQYLYSILISPVKSIVKNKSSLIIIPDGHLNDFPFEVLINPSNSSSHILSQQEYLINNFDITYQLSLNLWGDRVSQKEHEKEIKWEYEFSGFAPFATQETGYKSWNRNNRHAALPYSGSEIMQISSLFKQESELISSYYNEYSTERQMSNSLINSRIVHIASHSNAKQGTIKHHILLYPLIFENKDVYSFYNKDIGFNTTDGILTLPEIYNFNINSDLVILSTCSSGIGDRCIGEGNRSLSLGFYYSGANNIIYTTHDVSDRHTCQFMEQFYKYVCRGVSYSRALRLTKIDFINSNLRLPIFWCGYLLNG